MNPITHLLTGWCLAELVLPQRPMRDKALVTLAAVAPDIDGLGAVAELATRNTSHPLLWWTEYHHVLAHNLLFATAFSAAAAMITRRPRLPVAVCAFLAVHLHIVGDILGSRGPDGFNWPIPYLYPFLTWPQLAWSGQWRLNAWPNVAITLALLAASFILAWRRGYSVVGIFSRRGDRAFVGALRARFGERPH